MRPQHSAHWQIHPRRTAFSHVGYFFAFFLGAGSNAFLVSETRMKTVASVSSELP